ncbi:hypothetical protein [Nocardiopsis metallicus]|uniref:Transposase n=1 Tax=Nocardiopsis metallicus TaxID=179819 RepID=A0A840W5W9_9ACTN|nr:hypothetical protein [Nocardiopsis metallicus]MBB5492380.1 hypothetical protein [Nocardiopsis metallicus]
MNADHLAAWRLEMHGNPIGDPRRFDDDLSGTAEHRGAQVRHALTRLLRWAQACGVKAIPVEDLDLTDAKGRERRGRRKRFRQLISGIPTGRLRARLGSMADAAGIVIGVQGARHPGPERAHDARARAKGGRTPATSAPNTVRGARRARERQ